MPDVFHQPSRASGAILVAGKNENLDFLLIALFSETKVVYDDRNRNYDLNTVQVHAT